MSDSYSETRDADEFERWLAEDPEASSVPASAPELEAASMPASDAYGSPSASEGATSYTSYAADPEPSPEQAPVGAQPQPQPQPQPQEPPPQPQSAAPRLTPDRTPVRDADIDAAISRSGRGRMSSRDLRRMELDARGISEGRAQRRSRIQRAIPKTRTRDSEGGDLNFDKSWQKGADGKWGANPASRALTPEEESTWQRTRTTGRAPSVDAPLPSKARLAKYEGEEKKYGWRAMIGSNSKEEAVRKRTERLNAGRRKRAADRFEDPASVPQMDLEEGTRNWEAWEAGDHLTTRYDTSAEARERSRLKPKTEWDPEDRSNGFDMTHDYGSDVDAAGRQSAGFVMNPTSGDVHTFNFTHVAEVSPGKKTNPHHTSPLAGGTVSGAGSVELDREGHVTKIGDQSGHYRPEGEYTHAAVAEMARRRMLERPADNAARAEAGAGSRSADVTLGGFAANDPRMAKGWLEHEGNIFKGDLTLRHQQFLQTAGNERQARAKATLNEEIRARGARGSSAPVDAGGGAPDRVPWTFPSAVPAPGADPVNAGGGAPDRVPWSFPSVVPSSDSSADPAADDAPSVYKTEEEIDAEAEGETSAVPYTTLAEAEASADGESSTVPYTTLAEAEAAADADSPDASYATELEEDAVERDEDDEDLPSGYGPTWHG